MPSFRDAAGRRLTDYPRPSVAVDAALLTLLPDGDDRTLAVLEVRRVDGPGWALPGTFLHEGERLIDAVQRALLAKAGVEGLRPRQLGVFDDPERDDRGWVLSVAHADVVPAGRLATRDPQRTRLVPVDHAGRLPYDHGEIIRRAVTDVRQRYAERPDPDGLLPEPFTLRELRLVHEAVVGRPLQRDTFRRAMERFLESTGETVVRGPGRPAEAFRGLRRDEP
jgi:8-oxo-dGTP diphosphatase